MDMKTRSGSWLRLGVIVIVSTALAAGWLVVASLAGKAGVGRSVTATVGREAELSEAVTRRIKTTVEGTSGQVTYLTPKYLSLSGGNPGDGENGTVFIIYEENHYGTLSPVAETKPPTLRVDGSGLYQPVELGIVTDSGHHRTWRARFEQTGKTSLELLFPGIPGAEPARWDLPLTYPQAPKSAGIGLGAFLAITAGLFATLSPCLLQLTLYYISSLAGMSLSRPSPRQVFTTALWFVAGMTAAYTAGGALAGLAGQNLQGSGALGAWSRPIAITSGLMVVGLGLWTGASAGAPMLCKLPMPSMAKMGKKTGALGTMVMGFAFSLGCLQCFGGAIFAGLLFYIGSLGSPMQGALIMGTFSVGVSIPFLIAAASWSRISPLLEKLQRHTPMMALSTSVIMITFGILMVADKFHWLSGMLVRWFPFLAI